MPPCACLSSVAGMWDCLWASNCSGRGTPWPACAVPPGARPACNGPGFVPLTADITRRGDLAKLPHPYDWIVNTISSGKGGVEEYQEVYFEGTRNLLEWLAASPPKKYVHTGSTSVYGQDDASQVHETSPAEPATATGPDTPGHRKAAARGRARPAISRRPAARGRNLRSRARASTFCNTSRARQPFPGGANASST